MTYKAIRFKADELAAVIDNTKSEFRLPLKNQDVLGFGVTSNGELVALPKYIDEKPLSPPYCKGEVVYVKETWANEFGAYWYRAGLISDEPGQIPGMIYPTKWKPATQMPREAARLFLEITDVKPQHLQDITLDEIEREGIWLPGSLFPKDIYAERWDRSMSGKKRSQYGWNVNPLVWVFSFRQCERPEDWDAKIS